MPELRISTDKVCDFIEVAREVAGKVPSTAGDPTTTGDDSKFVTIEDYAGEDARSQEMHEFILGLNVAEQVDLLALILVGSGAFSVDEWDDAVSDAEARVGDGGADYMIGDPALPEYLGIGLNALGKACG